VPRAKALRKQVVPSPATDVPLPTGVILSVLLTPQETARRLGTTKGTLAVWRCVQRYPLRYVQIGRSVMYRAEDVQAFIELRTVGGAR
jgi:excisionase family DNA binding protein